MGFETPKHSPDQNPVMFHPDRRVRMLTYAYLHARHFWLLVWPMTLCAVWTGGDVSFVNSLADRRALAPLALYALLIACFAATFAVLPKRCRAPWLVSWAFLGLFFLPASQIFFPVGFMVAEVGPIPIPSTSKSIRRFNLR